jgi:dTDP-glucose 4,6-dehydratase
LPLDTHFAAGNFVKSVLDNECIHIAGDGTPFRSYLYAADLVVWLIVHLLKKSKFQAMNVGSDQPVSILDLAKAAHRAGIEVFPERRNIQEPIKVAREPSPDARPARYVPATERARKSFALEPWTSLPDALSKTLDWHRKYGDYAKRST